ncbi:MAG: hypothetical protein P8188_13055 [Gemmatimonadota bacterium]
MGRSRGRAPWAPLAFLGVAFASAAPLAAQAPADRIWAQVETVAGDVYEGFLRWDRNEGSWADVLNASRRIPEDHRRMWSEAQGRDREDRERSIEFLGFTLSWEEDDPEFEESAQSGVRFGHIDHLRVLDDDRAEVVLRSGEVVEFEGGGTDLGSDLRELLVEMPGQGTVELSWDELREVRFGAAPVGSRPDAQRLYGTVQDRWGNRFTGAVSWDTDEILDSDVLDGEEDGRDREIPFRDIAAIERDWDGARVTLVDGREVLLTGSNDVGRGHRGVQVSDPALGMVEVEWDEFESVRFHAPDVSASRDSFTGGHRLRGTVTTRGGDRFTGWIRWDADESRSWEFLDGSWRDVVYDIEFGAIDRIARASSRSARVTLRDGREFELEDSNDVDRDNKGIFVDVSGDSGEEEGEWVRIGWDEFEEIRFQHGN